MSWASKIAKSKPIEKDLYFLTAADGSMGVYPCVEVESMKIIESWDGDEIFVARFDIYDSNVPLRPAGTTVAWLANLTKHNKSAPGNVKRFLSAVMGVDLDAHDEAAQERLIAEAMDQEKAPYIGRLLRVEAKNIKTKEKKEDFTICDWTLLPEDQQAFRAQMREAAGFPAF